MPNKLHFLRYMAEKYLRLARTAGSSVERSKFFDYALFYAQLSEQSERRKGARTQRE